MRYWTVLSSGTRRLRDQLVDHPESGRIVPLALAIRLVSDAPSGIDDEGHRQAADLPPARGLLVAIEYHGKLDELALEELADALGLLAEIHADDFERLALARLLQPLERRQLVAARLAPRRPEIDHDDAAA